MCGIAGFTHFRGSSFDARSVIRSMTEALMHRGPDGFGYYEDNHVALGHRRLAVIDVKGGQQPVTDSTDRYRLIYNGEVYNYIELRKTLVERGHRFHSESDAEVVLASLVEYGLSALEKFDGMFALALWDCQRHTLLLARDRIGIKPLYYSCDGADILFASELKGLLTHPSVSRCLNVESVAKYFAYGYVPAPNTIFKDIYKLDAGHYLESDGIQVHERAFSDIPVNGIQHKQGGLDECCRDLRQILHNAVSRQLRSDVPVGVFLSGGIDSSTIVALAASQVSNPLHTFSIGFDEPSYDESKYARHVSSIFGTVHHEKTLTLKEATGVFSSVVATIGEPLADASLIPTYVLSKLATQHVKVVLGGDGSDELFAGYPSFQAHKAMKALSLMPKGCLRWLMRLADRIPVSDKYASLEYLMQQFGKGSEMSDEVRFFLWMGFYNDASRAQLFSNDFRHELTGHDTFEDIHRLVRQSGLTDAMRRLEYLCLKLYFQDDILAKIDTAGMANSLEVRVPFMDRDVVDYACRIEPRYKLRKLTSKYVLKRMAKGLLPRSIIHRRKAGFMMPVARWLTTNMRESIETLCSPGELAATGLFNPAFVRKMLDEHFQCRRDHRKHIYALLCFMAWMRHNKI